MGVLILWKESNFQFTTKKKISPRFKKIETFLLCFLHVSLFITLYPWRLSGLWRKECNIIYSFIHMHVFIFLLFSTFKTVEKLFITLPFRPPTFCLNFITYFNLIESLRKYIFSSCLEGTKGYNLGFKNRNL